MIGPLPDPSAVFQALMADTDMARATDQLTALVTDVVGIIHPDIQNVVVDPTAWGTGVYVGEFGSAARVRVWQSILNMRDFGTVARREADRLLDNSIRATSALGYQLKSWTLVLPTELEPSDLRHWRTWKKAKKETMGVSLDLWTAGALRRRLLSPEGEAVRRLHLGAISRPVPRTLKELDDAAKYERTLFIRQLREANISETFSAKAAFFNAEIMSREVSDKSITAELNLLTEWRMHVHGTWEDLFNDACQASKEQIPPGVLRAVSAVIHEDRPSFSTRMGASTIHGVGIMHQVVEAGEAGWVRDWRVVAHLHNQQRLSSTTSGNDVGADRDEA